MRKSGAFKVVIATCALALVVPHLSPASAAPAAQLVTCVDLASSKERISKTGTCRTTEATAKWRLAPVDSAIASGSTTKTLTVCSNKESSPFIYQLIRSKCARHMQSGLYTRSSALPAKPVIAQVSATSYESASLALASDPAANLDAPIAYYTITSSKGDVMKVSSWRDLNVTIFGLRASTSYTFTITATNVDGTSPVSATSLSVTTQVYIAPTLVAQVVSCANGGTCVVGDRGPGGGIVYYVSASNFTSAGSNCATSCKYLEVAPATWQSAGASVANDSAYQWSSDTAVLTGQDTTTAGGESGFAGEKFNWKIGQGFYNTSVMKVAGATSAAQAAVLAYAGGSSAGQWFIPSMNELNELCKFARGQTTGDVTLSCDTTNGSLKTGILNDLGGFVTLSYWSSSEYNVSSTSVNSFSGSRASTLKNNSRSLRPIRAFGATSVSTDARLSTSSTIKGQTPLVLGTPSAILASATGGSVSISPTQSADTTNAGSYRTTFTPDGVGANINRVVKYSAGANYSGFSSDSIYNGTAAIAGGDFFIIKVLAQDGLTILHYKVTVTVTYAVGSTGPGGGKIFYVANTPFACGPTRSATCTYLEAAPTLWNGGAGDPLRRWAEPSQNYTAVNNGSSPETATAKAIGWGYRNTRAIILQGNTDPTMTAAALVDAHTVTVGGVVVDDWYLPSIDELDLMYPQRVNIGGLQASDYWSSTEGNPGGSWYLEMGTGNNASNRDKGSENNVRPIRAF